MYIEISNIILDINPSVLVLVCGATALLTLYKIGSIILDNKKGE